MSSKSSSALSDRGYWLAVRCTYMVFTLTMAHSKPKCTILNLDKGKNPTSFGSLKYQLQQCAQEWNL